VSNVRLELSDGVATLTLNRPDARNAVNVALARELDEHTQTIADDASVRAVLLRGAGPAFCVGGDLRSIGGEADMATELHAITAHMHPAVARLSALEAPVVAAVHGAAAGAGMSLALSCDIVIAAASATFVSAFTRIGLSPDSSLTWFLPRLIGLHRALELTLTNRALTAEEALAWSIATRVVPDDALEAESNRLARELAAAPTGALGRTKRLVRDALQRDLETQLDAERADLVSSGATDDAREGITAFLEKRTPSFGQP
jgi:2-(1,2-epoxy-1,2-dihydrophenyl)acetyl-CoA isomerase